jgi:hypothetical protein
MFIFFEIILGLVTLLFLAEDEVSNAEKNQGLRLYSQAVDFARMAARIDAWRVNYCQATNFFFWLSNSPTKHASPS